MVAKQTDQTDSKHDGHEEQEEYVEFAHSTRQFALQKKNKNTQRLKINTMFILPIKGK